MLKVKSLRIALSTSPQLAAAGAIVALMSGLRAVLLWGFNKFKQAKQLRDSMLRKILHKTQRDSQPNPENPGGISNLRLWNQQVEKANLILNPRKMLRVKAA